MLVVNGELHDTRDEGSEWNNISKRAAEVPSIVNWLDFSATPRFQIGDLFPWIISDHPLTQTIYYVYEEREGVS